MRHRSTEKYLLLYLDGHLNAQRSARIREHLGQCDACRQTFQALQQLQNAADALAHVEAPPFLWTRIHAGISQGAAPRVTAREPVWRPLLATLLVAIALTIGLFLGDVPISEESVLPETTTLHQSYYTDLFEPLAPASMVEAVTLVYEQSEGRVR